jgi:hypothetical protein
MTGTDPVPNYRWLKPFIQLLRQGVSPEKVALTIALGIILGVTPVLGSTVLLCTLAATVLRLNLPAIQLVNGVVYPLQFILLIPFYRLGVRPGDVLIGRPLGMSCGCPITHCGVVMQVDERTGVIVWCVTGPLRPRAEGYKDLGYYIAEGYEGLVRRTRCELRIGMRYFFQPTMCMLQWRHSGLVNYLNRTPEAMQVRVEGLWIG